MFKVKYVVSSIMMLVRLDLNLIVSLFQHKCEVSETVSTTTLLCIVLFIVIKKTLEGHNSQSQTMELRSEFCFVRV